MPTDVQRATTDLRQHPHAQFFRDNPTFEPAPAGPIGPAGVMARLEVDPSAESVPDLVNHPPHYTSDPSGVECIQITRHRNFNIGNAIKYVFRHRNKGTAVQDLKKAVFYLEDEIATKETERWLTYPHDMRYSVSNQGRVRRIDTGRDRKPVTAKNGYQTLVFSSPSRLRYVHRMVVETFGGPIPDGHVVAHGDGDRSNNAFWNLRVTTHADNSRDRRLHGTHYVGRQNPMAKLTASEVADIRELAGSPLASVAKVFGVSKSTIHRIQTSVSWFDPDEEWVANVKRVIEFEKNERVAGFYEALLNEGPEDLKKAVFYINDEISRLEATR